MKNIKKMKIEHWKKENEFKYVIHKHHTARLKKILNAIFPSKEGWKFSVEKTSGISSVSVHIMKMPINSLVDYVKDDTILRTWYFGNIVETGGMEAAKAQWLKNSLSGYTAYVSDYNGIMADILNLIEQIISLAIAPQKAASVDGDYGSIPNFYKSVYFGKWDKDMETVEGKLLNIKEYENRLNEIIVEIKRIRKMEELEETLEAL